MNMKAIRIHGVRDVRVDDVPEPGEPGPGEVLVRVKVLGLCGSDLHYYQNMRIGDQIVKPPQMLGHEFSGVIAAVGPEVRDVHVGQRVAVEPGVPCGECEPCRLGRENVCPNVKFAGAPGEKAGGCDYYLHPARWVFPLPDSVSDAEGALLEPLGVALHALKLSGFQPGESAAVIGAGTIGLCTLAALKAQGAGSVIVSEPIAGRRDVALALGASAVVDPGAEDTPAKVREHTGGLGADVTFEAAGQPDAINDAILAAKRCGKMCIIGICTTDEVPLRLHEARRRELVIYNSRRAAGVNKQAIDLMASGQIDLKPLITHTFALDDAPRAFAMADQRADGIIKPLIRIAE